MKSKLLALFLLIPAVSFAAPKYSGGGGGSGDMTKAVYDAGDDGVVDSALPADDSVDADAMADADHGDVSWTGGVATVETFGGGSTIGDVISVLGDVTGAVPFLYQTAAAFTGADATPDVTAGQVFKTADTTTITDFDDGTDHTGLQDGKHLIILFQHAATLDFSSSQLTGHGGVDWTAADGDWAFCIFDDTTDADGQWLCNVSAWKQQSIQFGASLEFEGTTANDFEGTINFPDVGADTAYTWPTGTGRVAVVPTVAVKTSAYTVGTDNPEECYGGVVYVTSAATVTACDGLTTGMSFTVITIGATAVSVDTQSDDLMYLDGTALDDGDKATNTSTTGDILVCTYYDATGWYCASGSPDGDHWTDGGP